MGKRLVTRHNPFPQLHDEPANDLHRWHDLSGRTDRQRVVRYPITGSTSDEQHNLAHLRRLPLARERWCSVLSAKSSVSAVPSHFDADAIG